MRARTFALALAGALIVPATASAHGLGGVTDLPVPGWLFLVGGATVLLVSFAALGALWQAPRLWPPDAGRPLPGRLQAVVLSRAVDVVLRATGVGLFAVVWSAAAFGSTRVILNLAPTFVYVVFWVGLAVVVVLVGDVWSRLDPWRTLADAAARAARAAGVTHPGRRYPARLGVWPAVALLFGFVSLELVYHDPASPRVLALAILVYSTVTWSGMAVFGRRAWRENGDGFALYFSLLSRLAPVGTRVRDGHRTAILRRWLAPLARPDRRPGIVAFVAVMLGSVAFDGFSRSSWWQNRVFDLEARLEGVGHVDTIVMLVNLAVLLLAVGLVAGVYTVAVRCAQAVMGPDVHLDGVFVYSLVPIAFVYAVAHYLSYLLVQGQFAIRLLSDPYGKGWDLFHTAAFEPDLGILGPNATWYVQVTVLVLGHVAALVVAHDRAVALAPTARVAVRTQYATLALMVLYTVAGMWLLSLT